MKMRKFEVIRKDIKRVRITVSKDRVTVKIPMWSSNEQEEGARIIANCVASDYPSPAHTLRAIAHGDSFSMANDRKQKVGTSYSFDLRLGRRDATEEINFLIGDATWPIKVPALIAHICNDCFPPAWGAGFVLAISNRWEEPEREFRKRRNFLGDVRFVEVTDEITVGNMVAQHGVGYKDGPPIRYDALRECLGIVAEFAKTNGLSIHMPRIGCGLAGGEWSAVRGIIDTTLGGLEIFVYDLEEEK